MSTFQSLQRAGVPYGENLCLKFLFEDKGTSMFHFVTIYLIPISTVLTIFLALCVFDSAFEPVRRFLDFVQYCMYVCSEASTRRSLASVAAPDRPGVGPAASRGLGRPNATVPNSLGQSNPNTTMTAVIEYH